jgi:thioredoxin reductase (NADPH)
MEAIDRVVNVLIVGVGPAGLSVGAECVHHGLPDVVALEKGPAPNQTVHLYYPDDKRVDAAYKGQEAVCAGVLCFRDTTKASFLALADLMVQRFTFPIVCNAGVDSVHRQPDGLFAVSTSDGRTWRARHVVIAIGRMGRPNRPEYFDAIPAAARKKIHFDLRRVEPAGRNILVVGGGNAAAEFALSLAPKGRVTLSYRGAEFTRLNPMNAGLLARDEAEGRLAVQRNSSVAAVEDQGDRLRVHFASGPGMTVDAIVYAIGGSAPAAFLQGTGIGLDDRGDPRLDEWNETTVPGLFVAGELAVPAGKGSIITSFNTGKRVVEGIMRRLGLPRQAEVVAIPPPAGG